MPPCQGSEKLLSRCGRLGEHIPYMLGLERTKKTEKMNKKDQEEPENSQRTETTSFQCLWVSTEKSGRTHTHIHVCRSNQRTPANPTEELKLLSSVRNTLNLKDTVKAIFQDAEQKYKNKDAESKD